RRTASAAASRSYSQTFTAPFLPGPVPHRQPRATRSWPGRADPGSPAAVMTPGRPARSTRAGSPRAVMTGDGHARRLEGMTNTKTFVLVHGSWQGAWSWDGVRDRLRAHGHRVITPALPGRGDIGEDRSWIGHHDNVAAVLAALDADGA